MKNLEQLSPENNPANRLVVDDEQLRDIEGHPDILDLTSNNDSMKTSGEYANSEAQTLESPEAQAEPATTREASEPKELSYTEKLSDPVYVMKKIKAEKAQDNPKNAKNYGQIEQIEYSTGAKHIYGVDADGKKRHLSHDGVLESYGYTAQEAKDARNVSSESDNREQSEVEASESDNTSVVLSEDEKQRILDKVYGVENRESGAESEDGPVALESNPIESMDEEDLPPQRVTARAKRIFLKASMVAKAIADKAIIPAMDAAQALARKTGNYYQDEEKGKRRVLTTVVLGSLAAASAYAVTKYGIDLPGGKGGGTAAALGAAGVENPEAGAVAEAAQSWTDTVTSGDGLTHTIMDYAKEHGKDISPDRAFEVFNDLKGRGLLSAETVSGSAAMDVVGGIGYTAPGEATLSPELVEELNKLLELQA